MGEAKFTPGPWLVEGSTIYALTPYEGDHKWDRGKLRYPDGVNRFSASLQGGGSQAAPPEEMAANARLIAAAPDLYAALVEAADAIEGLIDGEKCEHAVNICWCGQRTVLESAQAAIRKATEVPNA